MFHPDHALQSRAAEDLARPSEAAQVSAHRPVSSAPPPITERQILAGRYELVALIGAGGMGNVYRARDCVLEELVALKVLRRELINSPDALQRFHREVKLARRVTHPNVARMFDIGEHEGEKFLTMEFIEGPSLASLLERRGPLPVAKVVDIATAIGAGLRAAHAAGVIHRDLKPDNVLIDKSGRVKIADFGIARGLGPQGGAMMTLGAQIGTPAYMAPEQVEGGAIDERADIYAFGAMLYELLTGVLPWTGNNALAVAMARLVAPPPDPCAKRPDLPPSLASFVMTCMAKRPADRFAGAADAIRALGDLKLAPEGRRSLISIPGLDASGALPPASLPPQTVANGESIVFAMANTFEPPPDEIAPDTVRMDPTAQPTAWVNCAKTVAVLPFRNLGSAADEHLAEGLTDDLIDTLSMTRGLRVRPRGVIRRFEGTEADPREIGAELDVQVVVDGTVRNVGGKLRVSARLISVAEGYQIWAKRFDRPTGDFFSIASEAAGAILEALMVPCATHDRRAPSDSVALDLYLRGRHEHAKFWSEGNARAVDLLKRAHERAPGEPMIMAGYAAALMRRFALDVGEESSGELAKTLAERALVLAPHLADARVALAGIHLNFGRSAAAARELGVALALAPTLADAQDMAGHLLIELGPLEEGIDRLRAANTLEPRLVHTRWRIARALALLGRWDQCYALFERLPEGNDARHLFWFTRARLAMWRRDRVSASRFEEAIDGGGAYFCDLSFAMCRLLRDGHAQDPVFQVIDGLEVGSNLRRLAFLEQIRAEMLALIGQYDGAMRAIEKAETVGLFDMAWLDHCPLLDPLRSDPRFERTREIVHARAQQALDELVTQ